MVFSFCSDPLLNLEGSSFLIFATSFPFWLYSRTKKHVGLLLTFENVCFINNWANISKTSQHNCIFRSKFLFEGVRVCSRSHFCVYWCMYNCIYLSWYVHIQRSWYRCIWFRNSNCNSSMMSWLSTFEQNRREEKKKLKSGLSLSTTRNTMIQCYGRIKRKRD